MRRGTPDQKSRKHPQQGEGWGILHDLAAISQRQRHSSNFGLKEDTSEDRGRKGVLQPLMRSRGKVASKEEINNLPVPLGRDRMGFWGDVVVQDTRT